MQVGTTQLAIERRLEPLPLDHFWCILCFHSIKYLTFVIYAVSGLLCVVKKKRFSFQRNVETEECPSRTGCSYFCNKHQQLRQLSTRYQTKHVYYTDQYFTYLPTTLRKKKKRVVMHTNQQPFNSLSSERKALSIGL